MARKRELGSKPGVLSGIKNDPVNIRGKLALNYQIELFNYFTGSHRILSENSVFRNFTFRTMKEVDIFK